jgi:hypothetical protein
MSGYTLIDISRIVSPVSGSRVASEERTIMPEHSPTTVNLTNPHKAETQKLIRCEMLHANGKASLRFVALDVFLLWAYMMRTRHNMECREYSISLWVPADEFESKSGIFSHSGTIEEVCRFDFSLFDATYNYPYHATRFVLDSDSGRFQQAMLEHIPQEFRTNERLEIEKTKGYCIKKETASESKQLVVGLFSGLNDIY